MLYFIVNQNSGSGSSKNIWENIQNKLDEDKIKYSFFFTEGKGHASRLADMISQAKDENICIVTVGGDGTFNEVLNGISDFSRIRIGLIPTGSGNDFARGIGMAKDVRKNLSEVIRISETDASLYTPVDLGRVSSNSGCPDRYFAISSGAGLDAIVCKKALSSKLKDLLNKVGLGKLTYLLLTVETLFSMDTAEVKMKCYDAEGKVLLQKKCRKVIFTAAMNTRAEGGGVPMAPKALWNDGMLSVTTAYGIPKWRTFFLLPLLVMAKHEGIHGFQVVNCNHVRMKLSRPMTVHMDGEYGGEATEILWQCMPGKMHFMM